ncbi:hypothetical protein [Caproicibacterium sp. BJN0003]|uniref:hypothetical protein n=1 Tax=Caproicibacterium sp. BJN0003 TaxID=2994078 RepID=UPI00225BDB76|nr:hypothetical protein [Caproicibacterium sp. BJN0003]UZT82889.1 hypothetical protein OP489_03520 [Caproicibacterium sp. BJN0003]
MEKLELFQTTVKEYNRFTNQLPIDYVEASKGNCSEFMYIAVQTRLMLLRKYTRDGKSGSLYLPEIITDAIKIFPENTEYLSDLKTKFQDSCEQSINHILADGTERTLGQSIDDTMYGLYLHADKKRVRRILQDDEALRLHCVVLFVGKIEPLIIEFSNFLKSKGVTCIEKAEHQHAPVISLTSQKGGRNITGSPFWSGIIGSDMNDEDLKESVREFCKEYTPEEQKLWKTAKDFTDLLEKKDDFSYDEMKKVVYEPSLSVWGDFSEVRKLYQSIPDPAITTKIRYNQRHDTAYIYVLPKAPEKFLIEQPQIISGIYCIALIKDSRLDEWRVVAFEKPPADLTG